MAVGGCSSSSMRSSLRSISSRRPRIRERLSAEVMGRKRPHPQAGGRLGIGPQLAERIGFSLFTLWWWEKVPVLCFSHITFRLIPLSRSDPFLGFVRLRQRFVCGSQRRAFGAASLLADQQNKCSDSYQHRNQNTDDDMAIRPARTQHLQFTPWGPQFSIAAYGARAHSAGLSGAAAVRSLCPCQGGQSAIVWRGRCAMPRCDCGEFCERNHPHKAAVR
jgi:hypothetical protein